MSEKQFFLNLNLSPEQEANRLGYELVMRFTKENHAFIVSTHEDKKHIHSHIYFNSTALDCTKKFKNFWGSSRAVRRLSDQICIENGLSIVENPKENKTHYGKWLGDKKKPLNRDILRQDIDNILAQKPKDFDDFLSLMKALGYEIKQGKNLTFKNPNFERAICCNSLKGNYTEEILRRRIDEKFEVEEEKIKVDKVLCNLSVGVVVDPFCLLRISFRV